MEKINYQQLDKLLIELKKHSIPSSLILSMFNIKSIAEINIVQYNCLLLIIKS